MELINYLIILASTLLILSFLVVRYYASRRTSMTIQLLATISFAAGFSGTLLLPIDLSLNVHHHSNINDDNENKNNGNDGGFEFNGTLLPWHILFWTTSSLAWVILPIVKEMILSGQFTFYNRFREGVRKRLRFVCIVSTVAIIAVIWLAIYLHSLNVIPVFITLANTYGLLLVSLLLGYGLIALPRSLWQKAIPENELRKSQIMAVSADEALYEAVWELQDCEYAIDTAVSKIIDLDDTNTFDVYYKYCVNDLLQRKLETAELKPELHMRRTSSHQRGIDCEYSSNDNNNNHHHHGGGNDDENSYNNEHYQSEDRPSMDVLIQLNRRLKHAQETLYNTDKRWESIVQRNQYFHEISHKWTGGLVWIKHCRTIFFRVGAVIASFFSGVILWSEATLSSKYNLTPFAILQETLSKKDEDVTGYDDFLFQFAAALPLLYMAICVASSIFKLTMFGPFALRGYRQSHGVALVLNSQFLARLIFPLGYNYLLMLKYDTSSCAFSSFLGQMEVVPLFGTAFSVYCPLLIIALCAFTLCNIYPRLMNLLRIEHEDAILLGDQETLNAKVNEGIQLLRRNNADAENSCEMPVFGIRSRSEDDKSLLV